MTFPRTFSNPEGLLTKAKQECQLPLSNPRVAVRQNVPFALPSRVRYCPKGVDPGLPVQCVRSSSSLMCIGCGVLISQTKEGYTQCQILHTEMLDRTPVRLAQHIRCGGRLLPGQTDPSSCSGAISTRTHF